MKKFHELARAKSTATLNTENRLNGTKKKEKVRLERYKTNTKSPIKGSETPIQTLIKQQNVDDKKSKISDAKVKLDQKSKKVKAVLKRLDTFFTIDPDSKLWKMWGLWMLFLIVINGVMITLRCGWGWHDYWWIGVDVVMDLFVIIDIILHSLLMYIRNGAKVQQFRFTAKRYILKGEFLYDVASILPFDIIGYIIGYYSFFRLNRIIRTKREKVYFELVEELFPNIKPTIIRLMRSIFFTLLCAHFFACGYFFIISFQGDASSLFWVPGKVNLMNLNFFSQYIRCYYWAFVTMTSYHNTHPQTNIELIYGVLVCALGIALLITIIGTVGSLVKNIDMGKQYFVDHMDQINSFMNFRNLPAEMKQDIREYYTYLWKSRRSLNEEKVFQDLPIQIQIEVATKLNEKFIKKVDIFQNAEKGFIERIVLKMKPKLALPNVLIVRQGEIGREMYLLSQGAVEVLVAGNVVATLKEGSIFGEIALLFDTRRNASIRSKTHCDLFILTKKDFNETLIAFPAQKQRVENIARARQEATEKQKSEKK